MIRTIILGHTCYLSLVELTRVIDVGIVCRLLSDHDLLFWHLTHLKRFPVLSEGNYQLSKSPM